MRRNLSLVLLLLVNLTLTSRRAQAQSFGIVKMADGVYSAVGREGVTANGASSSIRTTL